VSTYNALHHLLTESEVSMTTVEICDALKVQKLLISSTYTLMIKNNPDFCKEFKRGQMHYAIGEHKLENFIAAKANEFSLPEDLWRGWVNPATGIVPDKLGL
jgi:hypothetical protein